MRSIDCGPNSVYSYLHSMYDSGLDLGHVPQKLYRLSPNVRSQDCCESHLMMTSRHLT